MKIFLTLILSLNLSAAVAGGGTFWGAKVQVGQGYARSYVKTYQFMPQEIGIEISEEALSGLPHEMKEYLLPMPTDASVFPYKYITFDWNPHGHEPAGVYDRPHFDMHFYFISQAQRQAISCTGSDSATCHQAPAPQYLVSQYAPTPAGVPQMGWHWVDLLSPEFNGGIFTRTFIYGYYAGWPIFIEPMVTLEYLLSKETSLKEIRVPQVFPYDGGHFPRAYKVYYDEVMKVHKIVILDFVQQPIPFNSLFSFL